uniref:CUB domain-containing protein n=1 Tax=Anopheles coluzzii TaxID=1518534 RepID=A0A8W7PGU9_ANOCL
MNLWLVVFCLSVLHVSRCCCAVQQRSNVTDVIGSNELDVVQTGAQRSGRFFPFYTIGRIANVPCTSPSGLSGTCLIAGECKDNGGLASGSCSSRTNQAVCYTKSCGGSTNLNSTYFTNSGFPGPYNGGGTCTFTVNPSSGICQLRIDFRSLTLSQPTGDGSCTTDRLTIVGGSPAVVPICGENTGQHLYLNFAGSSPISLRIATNGDVSFNRLWNIELSQIACASAERAPNGCFAPPNDRYAFTLSDNAIVIDPTLLGSAMLSATGAACTTDFIIIPNPTGLTADRFCGLGFPGVTSSARPFVVYTVTNGNETPDVANRGFRLLYTQNACSAA